MRDGILCHSGRAPQPATLEGRIVRIVDRVAYINHDIDDAVGVLAADQLPMGPIDVLGPTGSRRIDTLVTDMVQASAQAGDIVQGEQAGAAMDALRTFMFDEVYLGPVARAEHAKIDTVVAFVGAMSAAVVQRRRGGIELVWIAMLLAEK